jgi:hypothetical protein
MLAGIVGVIWTEWGASGVSGAPSAAIRAAAVMLGLAIVGWSVRLARSPGRRSGSSTACAARSCSMFSSPSYLLVVATESVAMGGGNALLSATGHQEYVIAWVATVVGMHFLAFGRLFHTSFYWSGTALIAAGIAGATVGLADGGPDAITATSGLIAAASLFAAGGWTVLTAQAAPRA